MTHPVVVLDNGAATVRIGLATDAAPRCVEERERRADGSVAVPQFACSTLSPPSLSPSHSCLTNGVAKAPTAPAPLLADAVDAHADVAGVTVRRPHDRGCVVDWGLQRAVWGRAFKLAGAPRGCGVVVTSPPLAPPSVERATVDAIFTTADAGAVLLAPAAELAVRAWAVESGAIDHPDAAAAGAAIVVDAGFSATTSSAVFDFHILPSTVARVDLGGKALTNALKDAVSLRSVDVRGETAAVGVMKDATSFVSLDVAADVAAAKRGEHTVRWALPDGVSNLKGCPESELPPQPPAGAAARVVTPTIVPLSLERFLIPEALFHPSDLGLDQAGVAAAVARSIEAAHPRIAPLLASNILLIGAASACPNFAARLAADVRPLLPAHYNVAVRLVADPATAAWRGGRALAASREFGERAVTRAEWEAGRAGAGRR